MALKPLEELVAMSPKELHDYLQSLPVAVRQKLREQLQDKVDLDAVDRAGNFE